MMVTNEQVEAAARAIHEADWTSFDPKWEDCAEDYREMRREHARAALEAAAKVAEDQQSDGAKGTPFAWGYRLSGHSEWDVTANLALLRDSGRVAEFGPLYAHPSPREQELEAALRRVPTYDTPVYDDIGMQERDDGTGEWVMVADLRAALSAQPAKEIGK